MNDNIICLIIIITSLSIFLYKTFSPSIDIVKEEGETKILLWYNSFSNPIIERKSKIILTFKS